jgi:HD-GYP domain-containing protein (c-di-GMP phosphodiesterase class II)
MLAIPRISPIASILLLHALCLAVGFWICWCLASSTATASIRHQTQHEIAASISQLTPILSTVRLKDFTEATSESIRPNQLTRALAPFDRLHLLILDSEQRVVFASDIFQRGDSANWRAERPSDWQWAGTDTLAIPGLEAGVLAASASSYPAVSYPLPKGEGRIVVYQMTGDSAQHWLAALDALRFVLPVACVWTWGLQSVATLLVLARTTRNSTRQQHTPGEQQLKQNLDLVRTRDAVIFGLAKLSESRDPCTGEHLERISEYSSCLATALRCHPAFRGQITSQFVQSIGISSALHDVGKVAIRDEVLLKPGSLTNAEREHIQTHVTVGSYCLRKIEQRLGSSNFLAMAREIAASHHERWDGKGYPLGLAGENIPLSARIVAIADVYDALSVQRVYKPPYSHEQCVEYIRNHAGTQFDPQIVKVFLQIDDQFRDISHAYPGHTQVGSGMMSSSTGHAARATKGPEAGDSSPIHTEKSMLQLVNAIEELVGEMDESRAASIEPESPNLLHNAATFCRSFTGTKGHHENV